MPLPFSARAYSRSLIRQFEATRGDAPPAALCRTVRMAAVADTTRAHPDWTTSVLTSATGVASGHRNRLLILIRLGTFGGRPVKLGMDNLLKTWARYAQTKCPCNRIQRMVRATHRKPVTI
jgi:hypothetical protein